MNTVPVTDAWLPQVNRVVATLVELVREMQATDHEAVVIHPGQFRTRFCPGHVGIDLAVFPGCALSRLLNAARFDAIHLATERSQGWATGRHCLSRQLLFPPPFRTSSPKS
jgi:hypothetical protein